MAIKYLGGRRMQGTAAERTALNLTSPPDIGMVLAQVEPNGDIYVDKFIKDIGVKPQQVHIK